MKKLKKNSTLVLFLGKTKNETTSSLGGQLCAIGVVVVVILVLPLPLLRFEEAVPGLALPDGHCDEVGRDVSDEDLVRQGVALVPVRGVGGHQHLGAGRMGP